MKRRNFLRTVLGGTVFSSLGLKSVASTPNPVFEHGVASGDPLADRVILWTRLSGVNEPLLDVHWRVASDADMRSVLRDGMTKTGPGRDFTVKVDADGLPAGQTLYYQFDVDGKLSPVGRTRTLAAGSVAKAAFAVVSCANHPYGYFHVYRDIAARDDIDAVIHLGDYIYEYGLGEYATERAEELGRVPEPPHEAKTIADFRRRHAQYKRDPDAIALHGRHPMIAVWDDHELANDAWRGGAENHQPGEGDWPTRRDEAIQAWLEWMPVRVAHARGDTATFRRFQHGDLMSLVMLDTRVFGRDRQPDVGDNVTAESVQDALDDPERRLLGPKQESWLRDALVASEGTTWQLIGQQVMVSPTRSPDLEPLLDLDRKSMLPVEQLQMHIELSKGSPPMLLDTWNGYPVAREEFLDDLAEYCRNPVVLSGDLHTSMAGNLTRSGDGDVVAVEMMTGSVTSPGFAEYLPEVRPGAVRDATLALNSSLAYMETDRRGWLHLSITHDACIGEWHLVDTVHSREHTFETDKRLSVAAGKIAGGLRDVALT